MIEELSGTNNGGRQRFLRARGARGIRKHGQIWRRNIPAPTLREGPSQEQKVVPGRMGRAIMPWLGLIAAAATVRPHAATGPLVGFAGRKCPRHLWFAVVSGGPDLYQGRPRRRQLHLSERNRDPNTIALRGDNGPFVAHGVREPGSEPKREKGRAKALMGPPSPRVHERMASVIALQMMGDSS